MTGSTAGLRRVVARVPWRFVLLASYVGVNLILIPQKIVLSPDVPVDWQLIRQLPTAVGCGTVYAIESDGVRFLWSPVMAWLMAGVAVLGYWPWVAAHVAAAFLVRSPVLVLLLLVSYGFWFDTAQGNIVVFLGVAAMLALQGIRWGRLAFLALMILAPRPLGVPLGLWLLWSDRTLWKPASLMFIAHLALVALSGLGLEWFGAMVSSDLAPGITVGPTAWFGRWWLIAGIPLAIFLAKRGLFGWAGLAMSPYVTPQYVLWPLIDLVRRPPRAAGAPHTRVHPGSRTSRKRP